MKKVMRKTRGARLLGTLNRYTYVVIPYTRRDGHENPTSCVAIGRLSEKGSHPEDVGDVDIEYVLEQFRKIVKGGDKGVWLKDFSSSPECRLEESPDFFYVIDDPETEEEEDDPEVETLSIHAGDARVFPLKDEAVGHAMDVSRKIYWFEVT